MNGLLTKTVTKHNLILNLHVSNWNRYWSNGVLVYVSGLYISPPNITTVCVVNATNTSVYWGSVKTANLSVTTQSAGLLNDK